MSTNRNDKKDIIRVFEQQKNDVYRKQEVIIIQRKSPNKLLVRL
jgi:hypothetical protein